MKIRTPFLTDSTPKALIVGIHAPYNTNEHIDSYYEEFLNLTKTNGITNYEAVFIKLRSIDPKYFFTKGKLAEIKKIFEESNAEVLYISEQINGNQETNLHDFFDCEIHDRTKLILSIFEKSATTAEGQLQVQIARLMFKKTRLAGFGIHLAQQEGVVGGRGPGETLKEATTRCIDDSILRLKQKLKKLEEHRGTQRKRRLSLGIQHICLIGYTNSGKSTILNKLTHSNVLAEDKLFATLDTTTRKLFINSVNKGLISDTVGFIQQLPHLLIESFKSTLAELTYADLLLVITDIADPSWKTHIKTVLETLEELKIKKEILFVFNKADKISSELLEEQLAQFKLFGAYVVTSAKTEDGLDSLKNYLYRWKAKKNDRF
jgi:GTP-binding protein HflX